MSKCRGCGKDIQFARVLQDDGSPRVTRQGKPLVIPLDLAPPVYLYQEDEQGKLLCTRATGYAVSHFTTCPNANEFSRNTKGR